MLFKFLKIFTFSFKFLTTLVHSFLLFSNSFVNRKQLNLFIHHSFSDEVKSKTPFLVVVESWSILYSSKIVYLQVDWFTGYNEIMIEHQRS